MDLSNVRSVVGALARRVACVSRRVFVSDCGDLQVLQSSDLPLSPHRLLGLQCWISKWVGRHELEVLFRLPVFWFQGNVHIVGLLNSSSLQRCDHCDGVGVQDLFHYDQIEDPSTEEESPHRKEREKWLSSLYFFTSFGGFCGQILSCDSERCSSGVGCIIDNLLFLSWQLGCWCWLVYIQKTKWTCVILLRLVWSGFVSITWM